MKIVPPAMLLTVLLSVVRVASAAPPDFTPEEKAWIAAHPVVTISAEPQLAPIEYIENDQFKGLSSEYIKAIAAKSGLTFKVVPHSGWVGALDKMKRHEIDVLPAVARLSTPTGYEPLIDLSADYYVGATVVVTTDKAPIVFDLEQLDGKTVAIKGGGGFQVYLSEHAPKIHLLLVDSPEAALAAVVSGDADAAIGADASLLPYMRRRYDMLHVSGFIAVMPYELAIGVRKDLPLLRSIVDKSLRSLTAKETDDMDARWLERTDYGSPSLSVLLRYYGLEIATIILTLLVIAGLAIHARRQQRIAERSQREKAMFLAVMSHEIRSPMNAVLASVELLQRTPLPPESRRLSEVAAVGAESLLRLLDDVLDVSKLEAGQLKLERSPVDAMAVIRGVASLLELKAREKGIALTLSQETPFDDRLMLDRLRLEQVLYNIVSNAVKFTAKGGVSIVVGIDRPSSATRNALLRIDVADTGIGIDTAQQARLFKPYAQASLSTSRKFGGTGLGLVICRNLIDLMGGSIDLQSEPGHGTRVAIRLPCEIASTSSAAATAQTATTAITDGNLRVLVIEDTTANQIVLRAQLEQLGCQTDLAVDGATALHRLHAATYDIVLLDCDLPDISGYEVARQWRAHETEHALPPTPILALSGSTDTGHTAACFEAGMDTVLHKPIKLAKLRDALLVWCEIDLDDIPSDTPEPRIEAATVTQELVADLRALRAAWTSGDISLALHHAHRLSGASSVLAISELAIEARKVEARLRAMGRSALPPSDNTLSTLEALLNDWIAKEHDAPHTTDQV